MTRINGAMPFRSLTAPIYTTRRGTCYLSDSLGLLKCLPDDCIDLVVISPPFALLRQKTYGDKDQPKYVEWLCRFGAEVRRVLRETCSFVAGSNRTGRVAGQLGRRWIAMETDAGYVANSALQFVDHLPESEVAACFARLVHEFKEHPVDLAGPPTLFDQAKVEGDA